MNRRMLRHIWHATTILFVCLVSMEGRARVLRKALPAILAGDSKILTRSVEARVQSLEEASTAASKEPLIAQKSSQSIEPETVPVMRGRKPWTLLVYMAANNNLHTFALQNLREMTHIGSNDNINIVVQFDGVGDRAIKRYAIENGNARLIADLPPEINSISGTPQSLYQFIKWGYQTFPSDHIAIDLWNHGSGIKDPSIWGKFLMSHRDNLFSLNASTKMFELNRRLDPESNADDDNITEDTRALFADIALAILRNRGIAFNDSEEVYIDNQQLRTVLDNVCRYVLLDKKIDIVFMDACHMGMVELASKISHFANYMVASAEVEPGRGYNYEYLLAPFTRGALTARAFALHGIRAYEQEYKGSHADYTQAAVELSTFADVETAMTNLGKALYMGLSNPESARVFDLLKITRLSSKYTTEFYDPDYIDAGHLFASLMKKSGEILDNHAATLGEGQRTALENIRTFSSLAYQALTTSIIAETHGNNVPMCHGLGLFFPKRNIHLSYLNCSFDKKTNWSTFLAKFLSRLKYGRTVEQEPAA